MKFVIVFWMGAQKKIADCLKNGGVLLAAISIVMVCSYATSAIELKHTQRIADVPVHFVSNLELVSSAPDGDRLLLNLEVRSTLSDFLAKAPSILRNLADRKTNCEQRFSFHRIDVPQIKNSKIYLSGELRFEQWICKPFKTRIVSETASFSVSLYPEPQDSNVLIKTKLETLDLDRSIAKPVQERVKTGLTSLFSAMAGDKFTLRIPQEFSNLSPRISETRVIDLGSGKSELLLKGSVSVSNEDFLKLSQRLLSKHR